MAYDTSEITGFKLRLDPDRAEAVMAVAREYGEEPEDVSDLLGDIFCCYDVDDDGTVTALEVEWWGGREFDDDYAFSVLAAAAGAEDHLTIWDTRDESKDVYRIVFDGQGSYGQQYIVLDGVPVAA